MTTNARQKGKRIEREAVKFLESLGFIARRGQQHKGGPDSPDVVCESLPHTHIEVKGDERFHLYSRDLERAMEQARSEAPQGSVPVVLWKRKRVPWHLTWQDKVMVTTTGDERIKVMLLDLNKEYGRNGHE